MVNDLSKFEKDLLKTINFMNNKNFTHKNFMAWSTDMYEVMKDLETGEKIYKSKGCFIAIKEDIK